MKVTVLAAGCLLLGSVFGPSLSGNEEPVSVARKWDFNPGPEFPGAKGSAVVTYLDDRNTNALVLSYDFRVGGGYVGAESNVEISKEWTQFRFDARADDDAAILVRIFDSKGQVFQGVIRYDQAPDWQTITINLLQAGSWQHFSTTANARENDSVIHYPIRRVCLGINIDPKYFAPGKVYFANFALMN